MLHSSLFLVLLSSLSYVTLAQQQQPVPTPANIVCYQEVVASQGTYAQIDTSLKAWSQKLYQTLGLTGPIELSAGWARVPDRTGFENNCTGPYPNIADLFVHIQTNGGSNYDSISSALESFIAANRLTSQPNIVCSARSVVTFLPGCGKTGGAAINNGTTLVPPTNATGNATTSAPTNATGPSNATVVPTTTPTTSAPTNATSNATTEAPTTSAPSNPTSNPTTAAPTATNPTAPAPTTEAPTTEAPTTEAPTTQAPTTEAPTTQAPTQAPTTQAPTQGPTQAPKTHNVSVNNNFYSPSSLTINQGDTVTWTWNGGPHTVTSGTPSAGPDGKFCSLPSGQTPSVQACSGTGYAQFPPFTYSHTFDTAGTFPYYCTVHLSLMTGSITVNPSVVGGASMEQSTTGTVNSNEAQPVMVTGIWMSMAIIMSTLVVGL